MELRPGDVAVVTGAASGIGRAVSHACAARGMRVVMADVEVAALETAADALRANGADVLAVPTDVRTRDAIEALAAAALERFGAVDVVHNNAGVVSAGLVDELSVETWRWVLDVDLWSVIHGCAVFAPIMKRNGRGHIVNTASTAGLQAGRGIAPYNVAKFGVVALTETLRGELAGTGVSTSVLCPGAVNTRIVEAERNRPDGVPESVGAVADGFKERSAKLLGTQGLDPAQVAAMVLDAVETDRFWIVTHPAWIDVLAARVDGMRTGELRQGFGG
jgi:NAD(P)-dependent dehydrogenase (short-subunit alcohol dehydrogenase family)